MHSTATLRATLVKVANEHQDDRARDYLNSQCLWVDAYLIRHGKRNKEAAWAITCYIGLNP